MLPKPAHLGPAYAAQFGDAAVVAAYQHRPPYPDAVFDLLAGLIAGEPRIVLDLGCGTGDVARPLAPRVARVDAMDIAPAMLARGRALPGGDHPHLRWILGSAEAAPLDPPYMLATAGESLHWLDWAVVFPRLRAVLAPGAVLALVGRSSGALPWDAELPRLIGRYSTNREYQPYDLPAELTGRRLFEPLGEAQTAPVVFTQSVADYIEAIHSRNGFSRDRMAPESAAAFDAAVAALLRAAGVTEQVTFTVVGTVLWGRPR